MIHILPIKLSDQHIIRYFWMAFFVIPSIVFTVVWWVNDHRLDTITELCSDVDYPDTETQYSFDGDTEITYQYTHIPDIDVAILDYESRGPFIDYACQFTTPEDTFIDVTWLHGDTIITIDTYELWTTYTSRTDAYSIDESRNLVIGKKDDQLVFKHGFVKDPLDRYDDTRYTLYHVDAALLFARPETYMHYDGVHGLLRDESVAEPDDRVDYWSISLDQGMSWHYIPWEKTMRQLDLYLGQESFERDAYDVHVISIQDTVFELQFKKASDDPPDNEYRNNCRGLEEVCTYSTNDELQFTVIFDLVENTWHPQIFEEAY
jgi:hypothetical protein